MFAFENLKIMTYFWAVYMKFSSKETQSEITIDEKN